jgi:Tfp pilus assembly protein PilF
MNVKTIGDDFYGRAESLCNLGVCAEQLRDFTKAHNFYAQALVIVRQMFGDDHVDVSILFTNMGNACRSNNDFPKAIEYYTQALAIQTNVLGPDNQSTLQVAKKLESANRKLAAGLSSAATPAGSPAPHPTNPPVDSTAPVSTPKKGGCCAVA